MSKTESMDHPGERVGPLKLVAALESKGLLPQAYGLSHVAEWNGALNHAHFQHFYGFLDFFSIFISDRRLKHSIASQQKVNDVE